MSLFGSVFGPAARDPSFSSTITEEANRKVEDQLLATRTELQNLAEKHEAKTKALEATLEVLRGQLQRDRRDDGPPSEVELPFPIVQEEREDKQKKSRRMSWKNDRKNKMKDEEAGPDDGSTDSIQERLPPDENDGILAMMRKRAMPKEEAKDEPREEDQPKRYIHIEKVEPTEDFKKRYIEIEEEEPDSDLQVSEFLLPDDTYSFLITSNILSIPFAMGLIMYGVEMLLLALLTVNQWEKNSSTANRWGIPGNVEWSVRVAQMIAILIGVIVQDELHVSLENLYQGYSKFNRLVYATSIKWQLSFILRLLGGIAGLIVTFFLIIQVDTVFDIFLNFLGIGFISQLHDMFFVLSNRGYFGNACKDKAEEIMSTTYTVVSTTKSTRSSRLQRSTLIRLVTLGMYAGFGYFVYKQYWAQDFLCSTVRVNFDDEILPMLGAYSGLYRWPEEGNYPRNRPNGRVMYIQDQGERGVAKKGVFAYCRDQKIWTFSTRYDIEDDDDSPCDDIVARSLETTSFDILDINSDDWFTDRGIRFNQVQLTCVADSVSTAASSSCQVDNQKPTFDDACRKIDFENAKELSGIRKPDYSTVYKILERDDRRVQVYDHPVYWGSNNNSDNGPTEGIDLILFTGRRWVITDTSQFHELQNRTSKMNTTQLLDEVASMFDGCYHASQLPKQSWAFEFVSEVVDPVAGSSGPVGLKWYRASYPEGVDTTDFPGVDLSRPIGSVFTCAVCHPAFNPCHNDGECVDGTCVCGDMGATGEMCEIVPVGNGICDAYFNTAAFDYDGGDCCSDTCQGVNCGESYEPAFGEVGRMAKGFPHCVNPDMVPISVSIDGSHDAMLTLTCDDKKQLSATTAEPRGTEIVHVAEGASCKLATSFEFGWFNVDVAIEYYVGSDLEHQISITEHSDYDDANGDLIYAWLEFHVLSKCLLRELVEVADLDVLVDTVSPQSQAVHWLDKSVSEGSVCGSPVLTQKYAMGVLSYLGWFEPSNHCSLSSVTCHADGRVEGIALEGQVGKSLEFVSELGLLTDLESLSIAWNHKDTVIPTWFGDFPNLKRLELVLARLTGTVPTEIGSLAKLEYLDLNTNNKLGGPIPSELGRITTLREINLSNNDHTGTIPTDLGQLTNIETIFLAFNQLSGVIPSELGLLSNLKQINFAANALTGLIPSELGQLPKLTKLDLSNNIDIVGPIPPEVIQRCQTIICML